MPGKGNKVKLIKMFGLAATATLMAIAFTDAPSAKAEIDTALCKIDPLPSLACPSGKLVSHVHEETLEGEQGILLSSALTIKCDVLFLGDVLTEGLLSIAPESLLISGNLTYSNCNNSCTFTEENGPGHLKVLKTAHELARVAIKDLIHMLCSGFINCRYTGTGLLGHDLGPLLSGEELPNGATQLSEQSTSKESGSLCPSTAKLDLVTHPLEPTYITS
jgi:hypothetical protein